MEFKSLPARIDAACRRWLRAFTTTPDASAPLTQSVPVTRTAQLAWVLLIAATWMLLHLYLGLRHDSIMYSMQGLAHLHPELWGQDVYLRFGSQDRYTIFASIYAALIERIGLEHAAEVITAISEVIFVSAAWCLARWLLSKRQALMGMLLLIALPCGYGSATIFHVIEDFATPRLFAEALSLFTVLNWLKGRRLLACLCALAALLMHPLMALPGIACCVWVSWVQPRPRQAVVVAAICLAALLLVGTLAHGPPLRFDDFWFKVSPEHLDYLLIARWDTYGWAVTLIPLVLLMGGSALLEPGPARQLAQAALGVGTAGIAVSAIGGDVLHLVLVVQAQPWRCMWLSAAVATLLVPLITQRLWQHNLLSRAVILLLLAEYLVISENYSIVLTLLALTLLGLSLRVPPRVPANFQRLALWGATLLLALALTVLLSNRLMPSPFSHLPQQQYYIPPWVEPVLRVCEGGLPALGVVLVFAWALGQQKARWIAPALVLLCAGACLELAPLTWSAWTQLTYKAADKALFASWRAKIPPGTEVLYPENPLVEWILLERPSYLSSPQAASGLFSRPAAMFIYGRAEALRPFLRAVGQSFWDADKKPHPMSTPTLAMACATSDVQFVAIRSSLDVPPIDEVSPTAKAVYRGLKLYKCPHAQD
jgi:hypothetical protein